MNSSNNASLPRIQRRVKANARRLKLSIQHHQIFLTTPPHVSEQKIQAFLKESEQWLHQTWHKVCATSLANDAPLDGEIIRLPLLNQSFEIVISDKNNSSDANKLIVNKLMVSHLNSQLIVAAEHSGQLLKQWVRNQASVHLPTRLADLAQQHGFRYSSCTVRHAKTRWGSCSAKGSINLNAGLILMPMQLLDYVVLHELCHTKQLNHSALFWNEMYLVDTNFMQHRHELRQFKLPSWWHVS